MRVYLVQAWLPIEKDDAVMMSSEPFLRDVHVALTLHR
jgi:hypothetical protein